LNTKKQVYLLTGPRGSGKSHYGQLLVQRQPELAWISRDEILVQNFGSVTLDSYSGGHFLVAKLVREQLQALLQKEGDTRILLDYWTGTNDERARWLTFLRQCGVDSVDVLYFNTSVDLVNQWFWMKPGVARISEMPARPNEGLVFYCESSPSRDHRLFHEFAVGIEKLGFDQIIQVDPTADLIPLL
jgi:hypothetical protein